jgi:hypothetical protein
MLSPSAWVLITIGKPSVTRGDGRGPLGSLLEGTHVVIDTTRWRTRPISQWYAGLEQVRGCGSD